MQSERVCVFGDGAFKVIAWHERLKGADQLAIRTHGWAWEELTEGESR